MRPLVIFSAILAAVFVAACNKAAVQTSQTDSPPELTPESAKSEEVQQKKPAKGTKPKVAQEKAEDAVPVPPPKRLAPDGVYFVTERLSFTTDDGAFTVKAGTRVTRVKGDDKTMEVSDGQRQFTVQPFQVTNDLDEAGKIGRVAAVDAAASSAANRERAQQAAATVSQQQADAAQAQANSMAAANRRQKETRLAGFKAERVTLNTKIQEANEAESRHNYGRFLGRTTSLPAVVAQRPALKARLAAVEDEIRSLEIDLSR